MKNISASKIVAQALGIATRWIVTGFILYNVWLHSHWSIAISITLFNIAGEVAALNNLRKEYELACKNTKQI